LLGELVRPSPSLGIEQADAHNLRGRILQSDKSPEAVSEYRQSLAMFEDLAKTTDVNRLTEFHLRFGDLLLNLAALRREAPGGEQARNLLSDGFHYYTDLGRRTIAAGSTDEARQIIDNLSRTMTALGDQDRALFAAGFRALQDEFNGRPATAR
jgi:hypothetical protein